MAEPIGYIGYFSGARILDLAGIVTPRLAPAETPRKDGWVIGALRVDRPEAVVLREWEVVENRVFGSGVAFFESDDSRRWFAESYRLNQTLRGDLGTAEKQPISLFLRHDIDAQCESRNPE